MNRDQAVVDRIDVIAADVGRLARRVKARAPESSDVHLVDRIAAEIQTLDAILYPSADEIFRLYRACGVGLADSLEAALRIADDRANRLRRLLDRPAA